jgi:hypothetical protein
LIEHNALWEDSVTAAVEVGFKGMKDCFNHRTLYLFCSHRFNWKRSSKRNGFEAKARGFISFEASGFAMAICVDSFEFQRGSIGINFTSYHKTFSSSKSFLEIIVKVSMKIMGNM